MSPVNPVESAAGTPLRLLIDSNVFIALEPYAGDIEPGQAPAASLVRLAAEQGHRLFVHPATRDDLLQGRDPERRRQRLAELAKFSLLAEGKVPMQLTDILGAPPSDSNDHRDLRLLAALHLNAVAYLVTEDIALRRRASRVGLGERVLSLADAVELLRQLAPGVSRPPPRVRSIEPYALDADAEIFSSLREDYAPFDHWLNTKVRPDTDNRSCLVIDEKGRYAALAIVKHIEHDCMYPFPQPVMKLATFKVDTDFTGKKYGELLLKSLFGAAHNRSTASMYVEVLPKHDGLVELLRRFGFVDSGGCTERGEIVMIKTLIPPARTESMSTLEYHVNYGPPAIRGTGRIFVVPIWPEWYRQLFPDSPAIPHSVAEQLELLTPSEIGTHPWGNALRKAYLSNSRTSMLRPGDTVLFYRSHGPQVVSAVGVVEETLRSQDPVTVLGFVGGRTVYTPNEIASMCQRVGGALAILFRQDRFIDPPWELAELQANKVIAGWPQSITQVRGAGAQWLNDQLTEQL